MTASSATRSHDVFVGFGAGDGVSGNRGGEMTSSEGNRLYGMLRRELRDAGCFEPIRWRQVGYMIFVVSAFGIGYVALLGDVALGPRLAMLVLIAAANVHAGFVAHEIGHGAVTRNRRVAMVTGQIFLTFLTALS